MNLKLVRTDDTTAHVAVQGGVTTRALGPFEEPLAALLGPDIYRRHVRLDLREAEYIDSSGIGWLLVCHKHLREAGGKLELCQVQPLVASLLRLMKLERVLAIEPSPAAMPPAGDAL